MCKNQLMKNLYFYFILLFCFHFFAAGQTTILHPVSGSVSLTLNPGTYLYYDNGGSGGNYANNINNSEILLNPRAGSRIFYSFEDYKVEADGNPCFDYLTISYIPCGGFSFTEDLCSPNLGWAGTLCSGESLRFRFFSDPSIVERGWRVRITVEEKTPARVICDQGGEVGGPCSRDASSTFDCNLQNSQFVNFACPGPCSAGTIDIYPGCSGTVFSGTELIWEVEVNDESDLTFNTPCADHMFLIAPGCGCLSKATKLGNDFKFTRVQPGVYYVVVEYDCLKSCASLVQLKCKKYCPVVYEDCDIAGPISFDYTGNGISLTYRFTTTYTIAPGEQWMVRDLTGRVITNTGGSSSQFNYTFPGAGDYEVCFPYLDGNGCVVFCCFRICVVMPFFCTYIQPRYDPAGNYFSFTLPDDVGGSNIEEWRIGDNLSNTKVFDKKKYPLPPNWNCRDQVICCKFYDPHRRCWVFCCRKLWFCNPFLCGDIIYRYDPIQRKFDFSLKDAQAKNYSSFEWVIDSTQELSLGKTSSVQWYPPLGFDCRYYTISVRYFDPACGCWRICCRRVYLCDPFQCNGIIVGLMPSSDKFKFDFVGNMDASIPVQWSIDETGEEIGTTKSIVYAPSVNIFCRVYTISFRYWDGFGWRLCCTRVYLCDHRRCANLINTSYSGNKLTLSTDVNFQQVSWYFNKSNTPTPAVLQVSPGTYTFDLLYFDPSDIAWHRCRKDNSPVDVADQYKSNYLVYPNPAKDELIVSFPEGIKDLMNVQILDLGGKEHIVKKTRNEDKFVLDVKDIPNGIYLVKIVSGGSSKVFKQMIQHE